MSIKSGAGDQGNAKACADAIRSAYQQAEEQWILKLSLCGPRGQQYDMAFPVDAGIRDENIMTPPPDRILCEFGMGPSFDDTVEILRRREFRKDLFIEACNRMGARMAERMEDKEGWHDRDRQERLKEWGKAGVIV